MSKNAAFVKKTLAEYEKEQKSKEIVKKVGVMLGRLFDWFRTPEVHYERDFSGAAAPAPVNGYLRHAEHPAKDDEEGRAAEAILAEELADHFADDTRALQLGCAVENEDFEDPHWGHTTGVFEGKLEVSPQDGLPEMFRVGLFAKAETYHVICRPNYLYDDGPPIAISRLSIKVSTEDKLPKADTSDEEAKEVDLLLSEGVPFGLVENGTPVTDGQGFFFRDALQMLLAHRAKPIPDSKLRTALKVIWLLRNTATARALKEWADLLSTATDRLYDGPQARRGWAGKWYYSAGPYALGDGIMKYVLRPSQEHEIGEVDERLENPAGNHKANVSVGGLDGAPVQFDLLIQLATVGCIKDGPEDLPEAVRATEFCDLAWDNDTAPLIKVGTLTLSPAAPERTEQIWKLGFNASNTHSKMKPLGQLFRVRRRVHAHHREVRMKHSFNHRPNGCPHMPR